MLCKIPVEIIWLILTKAVESEPSCLARLPQVNKLIYSLMPGIHARIPLTKYPKYKCSDLSMIMSVRNLMIRYPYIKGFPEIRTKVLFHTPLFLSVENRYYEMATYFLLNGANPYFRSKGTGTTLLHLLVSNGGPDELLKLVLKKMTENPHTDPDTGVKGIFVNYTTRGMKNSPLHLAAFHGNLNHCKILMEFGVCKYMKNLSGKTPSDVAWANKHFRLSIFIKYF